MLRVRLIHANVAHRRSPMAREPGDGDRQPPRNDGRAPYAEHSPAKSAPAGAVRALALCLFSNLDGRRRAVSLQVADQTLGDVAVLGYDLAQWGFDVACAGSLCIEEVPGAVEVAADAVHGRRRALPWSSERCDTAGSIGRARRSGLPRSRVPPGGACGASRAAVGGPGLLVVSLFPRETTGLIGPEVLHHGPGRLSGVVKTGTEQRGVPAGVDRSDLDRILVDDAIPPFVRAQGPALADLPGDAVHQPHRCVKWHSEQAYLGAAQAVPQADRVRDHVAQQGVVLPVREADRRNPHREQDLGGQDLVAGRAQGLRHQPRHLLGLLPDHTGVRHRRLPPALPDREIVPHVKARSSSRADLPPHTRLD